MCMYVALRSTFYMHRKKSIFEDELLMKCVHLDDTAVIELR
jgi:hypothetical protein